MQTCVILAGGLGTRLRSAVPDRPKCLAPIGQTPFITLQIEQLHRQGIDDVVLSLGHMAEEVIAMLRANPLPVQTRWIVETEPLGTGGAIRYAMEALDLEEVLVANGDTFLDGHLGEMLAPLHRSDGELFRMALVEVPNRQRFGGVSIDESGTVTGFSEKGATSAGLINAGVYRLHRQALEGIDQPSFSLEALALPRLVQQRAVKASVIQGSFIDIGVPEDYFKFCDQMTARGDDAFERPRQS